MHIIYLQQALELAWQRRGFCAPNPAVGAVVVDEQGVIASGYHWAAGFPHAEAVALATITPQQAKQATVYVTLEPCCHQGKTPPCTELLINRGVRAVYYAIQDPDPRVAGKGELRLRQAGIHCERIACPAIDAFYRSYCYWKRYHRPWVTAKIALSLDGKIAGAAGQPLSITGAELNAYTHLWRQRSDALLTTAKTIIRDNPRLNARSAHASFPKPVYILDSQLSTPLTAQIFTTAQTVTLFHAPNVDPQRRAYLQSRGLRCIPIDQKWCTLSPILSLGLALPQVIECIGQDGIQDLWVEAGGQCFQSLINERLVQQAFLYLAPKWLGEQAQSAFTGDFPLLSMAKSYEWRAMGSDALCRLIF